MDYFAEVSDEFSAEISSSNEEQMESSDYRSSVSFHHKIAEKPKSKRIIRIGRRTTNGNLSSTKINCSLSSSKLNGSLSSNQIKGSLSSNQISGSLSSTKINGSLSSSKINGSLSSNQNNSSLSINLNSGSLSSNQIKDSLSSYQSDGSPSLNRNNSSLSFIQNNGSRNYDVPQLPVANATPHQAQTRLLKLINTVDTETREKIRKKSASMVADLQLGKKLESNLMLTNQENPITASRDSRLANITKESDKHSDCVVRPETARRSLVTPLDNFSPRPVMRREQQEGSVADVDPTDSGLGLEEACSPLSSSRAISGAEPGPAGRVVEFRPPCDIRGVKDKKKITLENKVVDKLTRKKGRKAPVVVDDAFELEEETPTSRKEPPIPVNNEKRGVKRYNVSEKLDTHVGKLDEKDVDDNTRCDEEPPKKKLSPDNKTKRKPYKQCDVYEPTTTNYAEDETESTEVNFKKPLLLLPKSKPRSKKGEELCSSQEEKLEGEPVSDSVENSWNIEEAKRSDSPKVDENREAEVPQKELIEKRYLNKWVPFLRNKKLYIEGYLINFDSIAPSDMSTKWTTSKIVSRISDKQVGTKKTCYVLEGQLAIPAPGERPVPLFVIDKFRNGFPENWKNIIEHWIHLNNQSLVTEVTNQTILNNISTISMTLFNSTPMPGMMSNMNVTNVSCIPNVYPSSNEIARDPSPSRVVEEPSPSGVVEEPSPSRVAEEPTPSRVLEEPTPSRVLEEPTPSRVLEESPSSRVFDDPVHSMVEEEPVHLRVSSLERCSEVNTQDHEKVSGEGGSDGKEEQSESKQETELPLDQEKYQRKSRSKVVRKSANRSTKNKPAESQHTDNLASSDKNEASSASTVIVDGKIKYPCEHCDYVGLQLRYLNTHKRKHKNLKTGRSHSNSNVVKSGKIVQVGSSTRSLSESSVADMAIREEQAIVNKPTSQQDNHENMIGKAGSQAENTSDAENLTEKTEPIISNKTMTLRDFAKLTHARNYPNTKMVLRQKFYLCQFCDFQCTVFKQLKDHLKRFHVDNENNESASSSKNFSSISRLKSSSPNPLKSKHRSKSPVKRKVKSKSQSSRVPSPEELFPGGHGQQETGAKKSRFGRKLVQNTSFTRTSWIDFSHTTDVYEPMATKAKKQGSMVQSEQKEPIFKKKSKAARTVKNPFRMDGAGDTVTVNPNNKEHVQSIKADPKTVRDRIRNSAILKEFSVDHEDDMFRSSSKLDPKGDTVSLGRLGTLDNSQSGNDISLHSSQTPVTKYNSNLASVAWGNGVTTPSLRLVKTPSGRSDIQQSGFEREAFIHRKVVENKKQAKDKNKKRLKCVLATDQAGSQLQSEVEKSQLESEVEQSTRIIKNVTAMTGEPDVEDEEGAGDNYFDDTQSVQFFCDPNPALMKLFKQRESRKNNQKFK